MIGMKHNTIVLIYIQLYNCTPFHFNKFVFKLVVKLFESYDKQKYRLHIPQLFELKNIKFLDASLPLPLSSSCSLVTRTGKQTDYLQ